MAIHRTLLGLLLAGGALLGVPTDFCLADDPVSPPLPPNALMVIRWDAELKVGNDVTAKLALGEIVTFDRTNGKWYWIPAVKGWIKDEYVVPAERAVAHFTAEVERRPSSATFYERGLARAALSDHAGAVEDFTRAIELDPANHEARNERGTAFRRLGRLENARADFDAVIAAGVKHAAARTNRALVLLELGEVDGALADARAALEIDRRFAPAWEASGSAHLLKQDHAAAIEHYRTATELSPGFALAHNNFAWLLATSRTAALRNGTQAVQHATRACELTGFKNPDYLDTLAAAHATAGQFEQAVQRAREALEALPEDRREPVRQRLALYESGQPYHE